MLTRVDPSARVSTDAVRRLRRALEGRLDAERLLHDPEQLEKHAEDWSGAGAYAPDLVVRAESTEDVQAVLQAATEHRVPVTPRGLGTGKSGGCLPIHGGVVLSTERLNRIRDISHPDLQVTAGAGTITGEIMRAVEAEGLFYPPDPNSYDICSIGGNVACNAGGPRAVKYGVTKNYVLGLQAVLPTGERIEVGKRTRKHVTGYSLADLLVGSEGTLAVITEATLRLVPRPAAVQTSLVSFADAHVASRALTAVICAGIVPRTLELMDRHALDAVRAKTPGRFPDDAGALIILETDGPDEDRAMQELVQAAELCLAHGALDVQVAQDEAQRARIWQPRRVLSVTLKETAPKKISEDIVVPPSRIPAMLADVERIGERFGLRVAAYGHAGDGNLHVNVLFDPDQTETAHAAVRAVLEAAIALEGTISGEHGIGLLKRDFLPLEQKPAVLAVQRALKRTLDPAGILNPGKVLPAGAP